MMEKDKKETFTVEPRFKEKTLSHFLKNMMPGRSWSQVKDLIQDGCVKVVSKYVMKNDHRLHGTETVTIDLARSQQGQTDPRKERPHGARGAIEIVYIDDHVVVVNKPAGLTTIRHPDETREYGVKAKFLPDTLAQLLPKLIERREGRKRRSGTSIPVKAVHRLDKETSGLLVFARTDKAASSLGKQFRAHTIERTYRALVIGELASRTIRTWIAHDRGDGLRGSSRKQAGKEAITHVKALEHLAGFTLVECRLETGRTHQIRIHLAEIGHPVCGEKIYLKKFKGRRIEDNSHIRFLALHATSLGFIHPSTGKSVHFSVALPTHFKTLLTTLRKN
ncbi:MAG: RluA family pseudouridine synthase [Candidatus Omnitrophica bacterium]|nr:RluA family pseudouridine synthase [Candidatus Omnitrophota bacterium]